MKYFQGFISKTKFNFYKKILKNALNNAIYSSCMPKWYQRSKYATYITLQLPEFGSKLEANTCVGGAPGRLTVFGVPTFSFCIHKILKEKKFLRYCIIS
jgi:hypothetical protein